VRTSAHHQVLASVIRALSAEKWPACLLDCQGTFLFVNEPWDRRVREERGSDESLSESLIGTGWLDSIQGEDARRVYSDLLARALTLRDQHARPIVQICESNTPTTARLVSTRIEPVLMQGADPIAVSVVHTTVRERPIEEVYDLVHRVADAYRDDRGQIAQCSCCRRLKDPAEPERWDLVPELLMDPPPVSHQLCELCAEIHYGVLEPVA
jgi:hypothetical protein